MLYYLSLFKVSVLECIEITSLQENILWGWGSDKKKIAWIK